MDYEPAAIDLEPDITFHGIKPPSFGPRDLTFDALTAGKQAAGAIPLLIVNEPILRSNGRNSDIRYNYFYPRWAYDQYRAMMTDMASAQSWRYIDVWDLLPQSEFTNSAVHYTPAGAKLLADRLADSITHLSIPSGQLGKINAP